MKISWMNFYWINFISFNTFHHPLSVFTVWPEHDHIFTQVPIKHNKNITFIHLFICVRLNHRLCLQWTVTLLSGLNISHWCSGKSQFDQSLFHWQQDQCVQSVLSHGVCHKAVVSFHCGPDGVKRTFRILQFKPVPCIVGLWRRRVPWCILVWYHRPTDKCRDNKMSISPTSHKVTKR